MDSCLEEEAKTTSLPKDTTLPYHETADETGEIQWTRPGFEIKTLSLLLIPHLLSVFLPTESHPMPSTQIFYEINLINDGEKYPCTYKLLSCSLLLI